MEYLKYQVSSLWLRYSTDGKNYTKIDRGLPQFSDRRMSSCLLDTRDGLIYTVGVAGYKVATPGEWIYKPSTVEKYREVASKRTTIVL